MFVKLYIPEPGLKSTLLEKYSPVTYELPMLSVTMSVPWSLAIPPTRLAQIKLPSESSLFMKTSKSPDEVRLKTELLGSKSQVPLKYPVHNRLLELSIVIE